MNQADRRWILRLLRDWNGRICVAGFLVLFVCFTKSDRNKEHLLKSTPLYSWLFGWYGWHLWLSDTEFPGKEFCAGSTGSTYGLHLWKNGFKCHLTCYCLMSAWVQSKQSLLFQKYFWVWKQNMQDLILTNLYNYLLLSEDNYLLII